MLIRPVRLPEDEEEAEEKPSKPPAEKKTVWEWQLLNDNKPIWLRPASEVTEEEYSKFFQSLSKACCTEIAVQT